MHNNKYLYNIRYLRSQNLKEKKRKVTIIWNGNRIMLIPTLLIFIYLLIPGTKKNMR